MGKEYFEIALQFEFSEIKNDVAKQISNDKHEALIFDEDSDELYSEDPSSLVFLVKIASGAIVKESIGWFFEYLKTKLKNYSKKKKITNDSITLNVHIDNVEYQVNYHIKDDSQNVKTL